MVNVVESMGEVFEHTTSEQLSFQFPYNTFRTSKMTRLVLKPFLKPYWFSERILLVSMYVV